MNAIGLKDRLYDIKGSFNVRDLGGYKGRDGKTVRYRRFIRAGSLMGLTPEGRQELLELGVSCVVDFRSRYELSVMPDPIMGDEAFDWHHIPMLDYINSNREGSPVFPDSLEEMYTGMLAEAKEGFKKFFALCADSAHGCFLYHCTAGKDRTGVASMLLLSLAGVTEDDIIEDYAHSEKLLPDFGKGPPHLHRSPPEVMEHVLSHLDHRYGGPAGYLDRIGVTPSQREAVTAKLIG
ncbi:MAG: tyrosine-protein phosphatase [Oscillospiraceae bacterium]|jgi:protein-tyrosine phosphatase|nr:tyrosine-protein phosphatase [Oscillospiraceae bacterium]